MSTILADELVGMPTHPLLCNGQAQRLYTQEEFDALDNKGLELVDGRLEEKGMGARSAEIGDRVLQRVKNLLDRSGAGRAYGGECGYNMFPNRPRHLRKPDVSFVLRERLPDGTTPDGWFQLAPDLAAEVISPNELATKVRKKVGEYLDAGVRLIWVIDPANRTAMIHRPGVKPREIDENETLSGEEVIPGFAVRLADLLVE